MMTKKYLNDDAIIEGTSCGYEKDNSKLTDTHIDAYIKLVSECSQFRIQSPLYLQERIVPINLNKTYIRILFSGPSASGHWICMFYNQKKAHIYDSLNSKFLCTEHKVFLNRLFPDKNGLQITFENAFAFALIHNICPCLLNFKTKEM